MGQDGTQSLDHAHAEVMAGHIGLQGASAAFVSIAPLVVADIAAVPALCAFCCVASRNRTSIRNKLNLKVRGF